MPTYEYQCDSCGHHFEQFQSIKAGPIKTCPKCKSDVRRLIGGGAGILFKGSGFYQTDYRSPSYQKKAEAEKKASAPPDPKPTGKGESKTSSPPPPTDKNK